MNAFFNDVGDRIEEIGPTERVRSDRWRLDQIFAAYRNNHVAVEWVESEEVTRFLKGIEQENQQGNALRVATEFNLNLESLKMEANTRLTELDQSSAMAKNLNDEMSTRA